ncbi:MAG: hypothetical protein HY721_01160 [Planctomycetes bacterium]|nr:hypothetical protein [Planctomycetota bacterium]
MDPHEEYFKALPREDIQLLAIREVLYEGSWFEMIEDLKARRDGKPYVFKLQITIDQDLHRIEALRAYEERHGISLGKYVSREIIAGRGAIER